MLTASFPSTCPHALAVLATSSLGTLSNGERVGIGSVCVCVYMHVCMHVCVCACMCVCMSTPCV